MPSPEPLIFLNAAWCEGVGVGFWPTGPAAGLSLGVAGGTSFVNGQIVLTSLVSLALTDNTTNNIYLDLTGNPQTKTTAFIAQDIPIAKVVTAAGGIVSISDYRNYFQRAAEPYLIALFTGDPSPGPFINNQVLLAHKIPSAFGGLAITAVTLPSGLTGSTGGCLANPTSAATITINRNGSSIGTVNISTGGVVTFTFSSLVALAPGDLLTFVAQASADGTLAGVYLSIAGTRS